jgi:hypothetical protein
VNGNGSSFKTLCSLENRSIDKVQKLRNPLYYDSVIKEGIANNLLYSNLYLPLSLKACIFPDGIETILSVLGTVLLEEMYLKTRGQL